MDILYLLSTIVLFLIIFLTPDAGTRFSYAYTSVAPTQPDYRALYPEQWPHGYCWRDCLHDINTFCSAQDQFCQSCAIYCKEGQTYANDIDCKKFCPAYFAYSHPSTTTKATTPKPTTNIPILDRKQKTQKTSDSSNISQSTLTSINVAELKEQANGESDSTSAFSDPVLFHWLWLLILPVTVIVTMIYYRKPLKTQFIRLSDKLTNVAKPFQATDADNGNRWRMNYFPLTSSPPVSPGVLNEDSRPTFVMSQNGAGDGEECNLLFDKSWPYPYSASCV